MFKSLRKIKSINNAVDSFSNSKTKAHSKRTNELSVTMSHSPLRLMALRKVESKCRTKIRS